MKEGRIVIYKDLTTTARRKSNYYAGKDLEAAIQKTRRSDYIHLFFLAAVFKSQNNKNNKTCNLLKN